MNENYSAPVSKDRLMGLLKQLENATDRIDANVGDAMDLVKLADEFEGLAREFRAVAQISIEEHQALRWEVQHLIGSDWENISHEDAGIDNPEGTPITFDTQEEALRDLDEHFDDLKDAGMEYDRSEWRVKGVQA